MNYSKLNQMMWFDFGLLFLDRTKITKASPSPFTSCIIMSIVFNGAMSLSDGWSEYIIHPQVNLYSARSILLSLFSIPVLAVVLNVLRQLVSLRVFLCLTTQNVVFKRSFRGKLTSHLSCSIGSLSSVRLSHMVVTLSIFSPSAAKRYIQHSSKTFYL